MRFLTVIMKSYVPKMCRPCLFYSKIHFLIGHGHARTYTDQGKCSQWLRCKGTGCMKIYRENTESVGCIFIYWGCGTKVRAAWRFGLIRAMKVGPKPGYIPMVKRSSKWGAMFD